MATNMRELLVNTTSETVERPRSLPNGHYIGTIKSYEFGVSSKKKTPYVRFHCIPESATPDVDPRQLEECLEAWKKAEMTLSDKSTGADFFITPKAMYRLTDALDGVLGKQPGRSCDERIPEMRDARVMFGVVRNLNDDGEDTGYNNVTSLVAAPQ